MPKMDYKAGYKIGMSQTEEGIERRKKKISDATAYFTGQTVLSNLPNVSEADVPIEDIEPREVNEFSDVKFSLLENSILEYGVIQPIIIVKYPEKEKYVVCSGHRRYNAVKSLHEQYPDDKRFFTIPSCIYEITDDEELVKRNPRYITREMEDAFYRETNLQARQLQYEDTAKQIRYILKKIEEPAYLEKAKKMLDEEYGTRRYGESLSRQKLIMSVLASQNYKGWSKEKIRMYLVIRDYGDESLLDEIENGASVHSVYKRIVKPRNRDKSTKAILTNVSVAIDDLIALRTGGHEFTPAEINSIKELLQQFSELIEES